MKYDIVKLMARRKIRWKKRWVSNDSGGRLTFRSKKAGRLSDYRIYGNTVGGESVGDRTANLFDMKKFAELCFPRYASVTFADNTLSFTSTAVDAYVNYVIGKGDTVGNEYRPSCIDVLPSTTYTISMSDVPKCYISWINSSFKAVSAYTRMPNNQSSYTFTTPEDCTKLLFRFGKEVTNIGDTFTISNVMLNAGSTPLPYEPYGYKVPIAVTNSGTTSNETIYLPEQIRKVGDVAEYVDYSEQKMHRIGADDVDVTLPALPTIKGTNVLSVGTAVQPSRVEVKGRIKAVGQETEPEPEAAEPEQEAAEAEQEAAEAEQEAAEAEQE